MTDELGHVTQYTYDENNNRTALTDANSSTTNYIFDGLNRLSQISNPLGNKTAYSYDPVGNVSSVKDANGATNILSYDGNNRLKQIAYEDGTSVVYDHDPNGNRTTMLDSRGTTSYTYDALDRLTQVVHPDGSSVGYSYDEVGNRTNLTLPEGKAVTYFYDALSRLIKVTDWEGRVTTYNYDAASNLLQVANPNSTTVSYQYDAGNRLLEVEHRSERRLLARFTYTLDELGNRIEMVEEGKAAPSLTHFVYEYDALSQLLAMEERRKGEPGSRTEYSYDAVGNRASLAELRFRRRHGFVPEKTISYIYDAAGRLLQAGERTYSYDNNGSRLTEENPAGLNRSYMYDSANRLTRVVDDLIDLRYTYDGDGNKVGQTIDNGRNTEFFGFLNDVGTFLPLVLREVGPDESIDYIYGLGLLSEYVARKRGRHKPRAFSYHADGLGSTGAITGQHAMPRARFEYDQWGNLLQSHGSAGSRFLFSGEEQDPETGLYYLRARWYDPSVGRFLTRDNFPGVDIVPLSINRYSYVFNNPLNLADPSGEMPTFLVGAIVGGVYGGVVSYVSHGLLTHNWWSRDALAATLGGVAGGTIKGAVALSGLGLVGSLTGTTLANLVGSLIETSVAGEPFNPTAFIADVGLKAGGDLLSGWFYPLPNGFKPTHLFTTSGGFTGSNGTTLLTRTIASQLFQFPFRPAVANGGFETRRILTSQILPVEVVSRLRK